MTDTDPTPTADPTTDVLPFVRARLAFGRHIADADVLRLCDEVDHLRALIQALKDCGT